MAQRIVVQPPKVAIAPPGGFPRYGYARELPHRMIVVGDCSSELPYDLRDKGYQLLRIEEEQFGKKGDPYMLYSPDGCVVTQWERRPSFGELLGYCYLP